MPVSGVAAREFSVTPMAIRIGSTASSMTRGLLLGDVRDAEPFSISPKWTAHRKWRPGSVREMSAISLKTTHLLRRDRQLRLIRDEYELGGD